MFKWVRRALVLAAVALLALSLNALAEGDGNTTYRAMLIGNDNYDSNALNGCVTDANRMLATLQAANEAGAIYQTPTIRTNLKAADMSALIGELTTWGVDDDDVTLFYFAGHGYATEDSGVPCFVGTDTKALRMDKLKSAMDGVPGTKLIVLDCRYADLLISKSGESADSMLKKFNQAVIDLFPAEEDYYVLTSSALASSVEGAKAEDGSARGLTTYYLVNACGYDYVKQLPTDALLGDADQNGAVSFAEARDSVNEQVKNLAAQTGAVIALDVQISPADSTYPLIARRAATEVLGVTLDREQATVAIGYTQKLGAEISPANASKNAIHWSSSDLGVATVDDKGLVTGVRAGRAQIVATAANGLTARCDVDVRDVTFAESIEMQASKLVIGEQTGAQLNLSFDPPEANETITWESSDPSIATVDENGQITAVGVGKCTIKAVAHSGVSAKCKLAVSAAAVKSITLSETSATLIAGMEGQNTLQLTAETEPVSANGNRAVKWKSSDKKVATVDDNGLVTAKSAGKAIIRATAAGGKTKADCKITVESNSAAYKKATVGDEQLVFTSARRIYYKGGYLVVEMYFANNTGSTVKLPEPGMLTLELANGDQFELKQLEQGKKKLKNKAIGTAEYRFKLSDNAQLSGLDLRGATATIVTEGGVANTPSVDAFGTPAPTKPADDPQVGDEPGADDQD